MDELDLTASEAKATYQEIKNYNTAKSENSKHPQCPPEKEKLIEEALRHFKMIS